MVRERKCILCHIVYSSKKEMDEHMRSMLHHRELENLKGRDSNHECQVCRVTVVGLSAYAKHISSQLHKDGVEAHDAEEEKEKTDEEYFDKELIQLIQQRNEQNRTCKTSEFCHANREAEGDDRRLRRRQNDRHSYQDQDGYETTSRRHHGPSQRDWNWEKDSFLNSKQGKLIHSSRNSTNSNRHPSSQRERLGWHQNGSRGPPSRYHSYGSTGGIWHQNDRGATSGWHHHDRGRNSNWSSEANVVSSWQSKNVGGHWKSAQQNRNGWNIRRNRALNSSSHVDNMDTSWLKINSVQDKYSSENYTWQWQEGVENYTGVDNENGNPDCLLDFTSDQLPSDQLLNFSVSKHSESKNSKVSRKCSSPSRDKTNRWAPYPSQKTVEQQPLSDEKVAKTSEKALSRLSSETADPKTSNSKVRKREESYSASSTNSKVSPKVAPCKVPVACTSDNKSSKAESKNRKMPSLKSPLLAIPDIKSSSKRRNSKNLLKHAHVSSSSGEVQSQLSIEASNSSNKCKLNNNPCNYSSLKGNTPLFSSNESLNKALEKAKDELQRSYSFQKSRSSSSGDAQSDGKEQQKTEDTSLDLKIHEVQTEGVLKNDDDKPGSINSSSNSYSSYGLAELDHIAAKNDNCLDELLNGANKKHIELQKETPDSLSNYPCELDIELKTTLKEDGDEDVTKSNDALEKEDDGDNSNHELLKGTTAPSTGPLLPELSKLGFPASLQRDLTWRTSLKNKISAHLPEPNLNNARRIRNVSGHRKNETEKESGLKPTLRQIISASRRNVNWEQVIQQVSKKKQEQGKGLPRFGIEMVPLIQNEQEGLELDEDVDLTSLEGFQWEGISIGSPGTVRKRSLSESSVAVDKTASIYSFFNNQGTSKEDKLKKSGSVANSEDITSRIQMLEDTVVAVKQESSSLPSSPFKSDRTDLISSERKLSLQSTPNVSIFSTSEVQRSLGCTVHPSENKGTLESAEEHSTLVSGLADIGALDAATDSSYTSSNEQNDSQGMGKKRRATGEGSCPEIPSLERKTKRRKIKGKKERSQVDQLLVISLREEELSKSLPCVDESLLQARAALQAAYIEVQRLLVLKQQISVEMGSLRAQRIQILQGLQETYEPSEQLQLQQPHPSNSSEKSPGKLHLTQDATANAGLFAPLLDAVPPISAQIPPPLAAPVQEMAEPTFQTAGDVAPITVPDSSIQVKREAMSPKRREDCMNVPEQSTSRSPQAELHLQDRNTSQQSSLYPVITASMSLLELIDFQKANQDIQKSIPNMMGTRLSGHSSPTNSGSVSSVKTQGKITPAGNTISEPCTGSFESQSFTPELAANENNKQSTEQPEQMAISTMVTMEFKISKKKKKLKKKKALRAARVPENSDTEQDVSDSKPIRKVKTVKIPKGEKVTTSTPPKQEDGVAAQERKRKNEKNDSDTSLEFVEVPKSPLEVVAINSSESESEKPDSPSKRDTLSSTDKLLRESSRSGYDEVSSTSEIGVNYKDDIGRSVAETQTPLSSLRGSKTSSEVSSEPGEDEDPTEGIFEGHSASVNAIQIFGNVLYTCSADKTVRAYNLVNRKCVGVFEGHASKVNCLLVIQTTGKNAALYSGSSDHNINCYNVKTRELIDQFKLDDRVLCLHSRWRILYAGLANGNVVTFNIKNNRQLETFECHGPRAISCLATAQEGARRLLIVGSYDCTISVRDARNGLLLRTLEGHSKTVLCMKVVNDLVFSGSSDQSVHAHNIHTGELVRIYKGHNHAVTVVNILGKVMVTACLDKCVRVYELQSHDRLQVYGGHSDMIMCMTIHKSMIYTGCYDGSIQAVRLNLMQNYRCWWHGCSLIFGVVDHLKQHLLNDHTNPNFQTLKCRWKNCDAFFTSRKSSKQDALGHIEKHAEDDSKIDS